MCYLNVGYACVLLFWFTLELVFRINLCEKSIFLLSADTSRLHQSTFLLFRRARRLRSRQQCIICCLIWVASSAWRLLAWMRGGIYDAFEKSIWQCLANFIASFFLCCEVPHLLSGQYAMSDSHRCMCEIRPLALRDDQRIFEATACGAEWDGSFQLIES